MAKAEYTLQGDWDLRHCLEYNSQSFDLLDVNRTLAVFPGEHDGADWYWLLLLKDGRIAALQGGCDYSGWDCQSSADSIIGEKAVDVVGWFKENRWNETPLNAAAREELLRQVREGVATTPRQEVAAQMGLENG